jgi:hypothetical protein
MNATLATNSVTPSSTLTTNLCGINMTTELLANKANLAMNGFDLSPASHRQFDDIEDWYSREFLIMCSAVQQTYTTSQSDELLHDLTQYNRANGRPEVAEALTGIFSKVEPREPCRVISLRRKGDTDSRRGGVLLPTFRTAS